MNISRRSFLGGALGASAAVALPGCCSFCCAPKKAKVAVQLYSIRQYINGDKKAGTTGVGIAKALKELAAIGYKGVEFAGYYGLKAEELKKMLDDNGLVACGTHLGRNALAPDQIKKTAEFNLILGNKNLICPGGGNGMPKDWVKSGKKGDDWWKFLTEFYNKAAEDAAKFDGCKVGFHNHTWEFDQKLSDGKTTVWDYFFSNTVPAVCMEQDVGWTTCAGHDPCEQYIKYPHRSPTLHAKENGMGAKGVEFTSILGDPPKGAKGVEWDRLFPVTDKDGVEWYVVECERLGTTLKAVTKSFEFLKSKGRC